MLPTKAKSSKILRKKTLFLLFVTFYDFLYLQKVISKKTILKKLFSVGEQDPDSVRSRNTVRIRIGTPDPDPGRPKLVPKKGKKGKN
jgi:hypothetical protein